MRESPVAFLRRCLPRLWLATDTGKALPAPADERERVEAFMREFAKAQPDPRFFEVLDVARRIIGTGSLRLERYAIRVRGGGPEGCRLLDLKAAAASSLAPA